jgi:hypothetical protein
LFVNFRFSASIEHPHTRRSGKMKDTGNTEDGKWEIEMQLHQAIASSRAVGAYLRA